MLNILLDSVIIFLLLYALFTISSKIACLCTKKADCKTLHAVLLPENADTLEYSVRCAAAKCARAGIELFVIDKGLSEHDEYIIKALSEEFPFVSVITQDAYVEKFY